MAPSAAAPGMCICVDCRWVDQCQAYHAVERQHGVPHLSSHPTFVPDQPRIHVQVQNPPAGQVGVEWDVQACGSFSLERGRWRRLCPDQVLPG